MIKQEKKLSPEARKAATEKQEMKSMFDFLRLTDAERY